MCIEESKKKILLSLTSVYWGEPSARLLCAAHSRVASVLEEKIRNRHPMSCPPLSSDSAGRPPPIALDLQPLVAFLVDYVEENGGDGAAELCKK